MASPAVDLAISSGITAVCRSDGSVDLRGDVREKKDAGPWRFVPLVKGQRFVRVAATRVLAARTAEPRGDAFLALTSRGGVFLLLHDHPKPIDFCGASQSGARFAMDASTGRAYLGLEVGSLLEARSITRQIVEVLPSGDMPVTALAAGAGRVAVARADGSFEEVDEASLARTPAETVDHSLRAAACSKRWTAVADDQAQVRWYRRPEGKAPLRPQVVTTLSSPARALVPVPRARPEEDPEEQHVLFAALVGRSTILLLGAPTFEPVAKVDLDGVDVRAIVPFEGPVLRLATDGPGGELSLPLVPAR